MRCRGFRDGCSALKPSSLVSVNERQGKVAVLSKGMKVLPPDIFCSRDDCKQRHLPDLRYDTMVGPRVTMVERSRTARARHDPTRTSYMVENTEIINHCFGRYLGVRKEDKRTMKIDSWTYLVRFFFLTRSRWCCCCARGRLNAGSLGFVERY